MVMANVVEICVYKKEKKGDCQQLDNSWTWF